MDFWICRDSTPEERTRYGTNMTPKDVITFGRLNQHHPQWWLKEAMERASLTITWKKVTVSYYYGGKDTESLTFIQSQPNKDAAHKAYNSQGKNIVTIIVDKDCEYLSGDNTFYMRVLPILHAMKDQPKVYAMEIVMTDSFQLGIGRVIPDSKFTLENFQKQLNQVK